MATNVSSVNSEPSRDKQVAVNHLGDQTVSFLMAQSCLLWWMFLQAVHRATSCTV